MFLNNKFVILLIIFIAVFCAILLFRIIVSYLLEQSYKKYLLLKKASKKILPSSRKKFEKEEEEKMREKLDIPKANSKLKAELRQQRMQAVNDIENNSYEIIPSKEQELDQKEMSQTQIVDIVKPIGFWTSMILGQKLTYLVQSAQMLNKRGDKGFWAAMIEAKERQAGRQHSRGR